MGTTQMQRFEHVDTDEKLKILKGAIQGLTDALTYHIKITNKHTERIEQLENKLKDE